MPWWLVLSQGSPGSLASRQIAPGASPHQIARDPLKIISELPPALYNILVPGDTDHDGRGEAIIWWYRSSTESFHYQILENQGGDNYTVEFVGPNLIPLATGDLDGDGLADLVGWSGGTLQVYESPDSHSYPSELVWSSPPVSNVIDYTTIGDTDRDGRHEIIHSDNTLSGHGSTLRIFENTDDNEYVEVFTSSVPDGAVGSKVIADFDQDGLMEVAFYSYPRVYVYESPCDNTWQLEWSGTTELDGQTDSRGGVDTDGNGKPELFVTGGGPAGLTTIVFEAVDIDSFVRITSFANDMPTGAPSTALVKPIPNNAPLYVVNGTSSAWMYQAQNEGEWRFAGQLADPSGYQVGLYSFDANHNGRDEIYWTAEYHPTLVYEEEVPTVTEAVESPRDRWMFVTPNPCLGDVVIHLPAEFIGPRIRLAVFDPRGRRVHGAEFELAPGRELRWSSSGLSAGIYFIRLEDSAGRVRAVQKLTVN